MELIIEGFILPTGEMIPTVGGKDHEAIAIELVEERFKREFRKSTLQNAEDFIVQYVGAIKVGHWKDYNRIVCTNPPINETIAKYRSHFSLNGFRIDFVPLEWF